jgi:hypothetical protein
LLLRTYDQEWQSFSFHPSETRAGCGENTKVSFYGNRFEKCEIKEGLRGKSASKTLVKNVKGELLREARFLGLGCLDQRAQMTMFDWGEVKAWAVEEGVNNVVYSSRRA